MRFWRRYRTAGVQVSAGVHREIAAGNSARDRRDWPAAAAAYRRALDLRPDLAHIQVQLGHSLKEAHRWTEAERVYRDTVDRDPAGRDAVLALGHLLKETHRMAEAATLYASLAAACPTDAEAMREARDALGHVDGLLRRELVGQLLALLPSDPATEQVSSARAAEKQPNVVFDVSDLVSYFSHSRRPTGIQRVQIEVVIQIVDHCDARPDPVGICCFVDGRDEWVAVPERLIVRLAHLSLAGDAGDQGIWDQTRDRLHLHLLAAERIDFARGAALVNLGTSWWLQNYFLHVRAAQRERGLIYIPMAYDMIPAIRPDVCIDPLVQDFVAWASGIFGHADRFLAISEATKADLLALADRLGRPLDPSFVTVVPLDASHSARSSSDAELPEALGGGAPFVLFVATIEPRKGHLTAFRAWQHLLRENDARSVPMLVCVGRKGWRDDAIHSLLADDPSLSAKVLILSEIPDDTLSALYGSSLFTVYPSLYEGWGLPVTEALSRGKMVITTTSSSLPEAGGEFALYVPPEEPVALAEAVAMLAWNADYRRQCERRIVEGFAARGWAMIADDLWRSADALRRRGGSRAVPLPGVADAAFQWIGRSMALEPRPGEGTGEAFRADTGWYAPGDWGCRVKPAGGTLAFRDIRAAPAGPSASTALIRLVGARNSRCSFLVKIDDATIEGVLGPREGRSITIPFRSEHGRIVAVAVAGSTVDYAGDERGTAGGATIETVGVAGFSIAFCADQPVATGETPVVAGMPSAGR